MPLRVDVFELLRACEDVPERVAVEDSLPEWEGLRVCEGLEDPEPVPDDDAEPEFEDD